jgi:hypothetical protein
VIRVKEEAKTVHSVFRRRQFYREDHGMEARWPPLPVDSNRADGHVIGQWIVLLVGGVSHCLQTCSRQILRNGPMNWSKIQNKIGKGKIIYVVGYEAENAMY